MSLLDFFMTFAMRSSWISLLLADFWTLARALASAFRGFLSWCVCSLPCFFCWLDSSLPNVCQPTLDVCCPDERPVPAPSDLPVTFLFLDWLELPFLSD